MEFTGLLECGALGVSMTMHRVLWTPGDRMVASQEQPWDSDRISRNRDGETIPRLNHGTVHKHCVYFPECAQQVGCSSNGWIEEARAEVVYVWWGPSDRNASVEWSLPRIETTGHRWRELTNLTFLLSSHSEGPRASVCDLNPHSCMKLVFILKSNSENETPKMIPKHCVITNGSPSHFLSSILSLQLILQLDTDAFTLFSLLTLHTWIYECV